MFEADSFPDQPLLSTSDLAEGLHHLVLEVIGAEGEVYRDEVELGVDYARWLTPDDHARLSGTIALAAEITIAEEHLDSYTVALAPIVDGERAGRVVLRSDTAPPVQLSLDTTQFDDGAYDLVVEVRTRRGRVGERSRRVVFENWTGSTNPSFPRWTEGGLAPKRLRTIEKSPGLGLPVRRSRALLGRRQPDRT